ncbi:hypothetical protein ACOZ4B_04210 [Haloferax prahovense]|uniref:hypothetical protein n=1 Tax=Haloferax TaxID=2251 RepID=UPI0005B21949|nr:hypothetical protein [Haloferax sp. ATB1]
MSERTTELRQLTTELRTHDDVDDAFLAKSFTDRHVIVDIKGDSGVPSNVANRLAAHGLRGADEVYGDDEHGSFAGAVGDATRHHFVDVQTRGAHQSYV